MIDISTFVQPPKKGRLNTKLANTGVTESSNSVPLLNGHFATLMVGGTAVRVAWSDTTAQAVASTDLLLMPGARFDWVVENDTQFITVEAADGSSAYEVDVWVSSNRVF